MTLSKFEKYWLAWLLVVAGVFGILETQAIYRKTPEHTLTHVSRKALGIHPNKPRRFVTIPLLITGCAWLATHIITGKYGFRS